VAQKGFGELTRLPANTLLTGFGLLIPAKSTHARLNSVRSRLFHPPNSTVGFPNNPFRPKAVIAGQAFPFPVTEEGRYQQFQTASRNPLCVHGPASWATRIGRFFRWGRAIRHIKLHCDVRLSNRFKSPETWPAFLMRYPICQGHKQNRAEYENRPN